MKRHLQSQRIEPGLRLALAVGLAYLASWSLGWPQPWWAVMSTLVVMRPLAGATLAAVRQRFMGTAMGVACGLLGALVQPHSGLGTSAVTLLIVMALAAFGATSPAARSAAITALIVLGPMNAGDAAAWHVALLRAAQVGLGIAVALPVALLGSRTRARQRLYDGCTTAVRPCCAGWRRSCRQSHRLACRAPQARFTRRWIAWRSWRTVPTSHPAA